MGSLSWSIMCVLLLGLIGCSDAHVDEDKFVVVTTISPITSIVENIGGSRIKIVGVIPEGVNSHTFKPAPSIAKVIASADLIVLNGLSLEQPFMEMANVSKKPETTIVSLGDNILTKDEWVFDFSFPVDNGHPNPHLWTDPLLALEYAKVIRDYLVKFDPINEAYYTENFDKLAIIIEDLHTRIKISILTIPEQNRKLLTYHDSFPFFADRYGMEIIGAIQPSDFSRPSAREVAKLIEQIKLYRIPAIFGSSVFPSDIMEQIAREAGARFIDELRDDDLPGNPGDSHHTYMGLILNNVQIIVSALGGNVTALDGFDPSRVFEGISYAEYPQ